MCNFVLFEAEIAQGARTTHMKNKQTKQTKTQIKKKSFLKLCGIFQSTNNIAEFQTSNLFDGNILSKKIYFKKDKRTR